MKQRLLVLIICALVLVSLACGGGNGGTPTESAPNTVAPVNNSGGGLNIKIDNRSPMDICYVYISPSSADAWGADQLSDEETIGSGSSKSFSLAADTYDVRLENCDEHVVGTGWEISSAETLVVGDSRATTALLVSNESSTDVCYVYISSPSAEDWGADWMGDSESIPSGSSRVFFVESGTYDLDADDCDGETLVEEFGVDLSDDLVWTLSD